MATASSAQREPSMEEILASIRRIIEDSDTSRKPVQEMAEVQPDASVSAAAIAETGSAEVAAFRSELRAEPQAPKPVTLADVQAQLAAVAEPDRPAAPVITLAEVGTRAMAERPQIDEPSLQAVEPEVAEAAPVSWPREVAAEPLSEIARVETPVARSDDHEIAREPARVAVAPHYAEQLSSVEATPLRPSLISEQASRQVAASFEELSEAFASRSKKSFDDMAAEMLQPMLQDWLDNNLPTLVERLVREEIERIARGA